MKDFDLTAIDSTVSKFNSLRQIVRIAILASGLVLLLLLWYFYSYSDYGAKNVSMAETHSTINEQISSLKNLTNRQKRFVYEDSLIGSEELSDLLESLLSGNTELELVSLTKKKPVLLNKNKDKSLSEIHEVLGQKLQANDIEVKLTGDYFSFMKYLHRLSQLSSGRIFWQDLKYFVTEYPKADITMVLRTLSKA